jgi:DNA-binding transcriptional LysR family regulator
VAELEARLGIRLFQRTTRKVGLTPAGADLLARAPALLDDLDTLLAEVSEGSKGFSGVIRLSAPVTFGELYVVGMLERFGRENPDLMFDLRLSDQFSDLASEGIDLAFRLGRSAMQSMKTRKLGTFRSTLVASTAFLERYGTPQHPSDLSQLPCIIDNNRLTPKRWTFTKGTEAFDAPVQGRFQVNSARAGVELALQGVGIAYPPRFAIGSAIESGGLVPLLKDYDVESGPISAVYLEGRTLPRKVRALIDFAVEDIKNAGIL